MEESEEEGEMERWRDGEMEALPIEAGAPACTPGMDPVLPDGVDSIVPSLSIDLRNETHMVVEAHRQLHMVL